MPSPHALHSTIPQALPAICFWLFMSCSTILFNKYLYTGTFPYPLTLTSIHMTFATLATGALRAAGRLPVPTLGWSFYARNVVPIGVLFAFSLGLSNLAAMRLSVSFIQMVKALTPMLTLGVAVLMRLEKATATLVTRACGEGWAMATPACPAPHCSVFTSARRSQAPPPRTPQWFASCAWALSLRPTASSSLTPLGCFFRLRALQQKQGASLPRSRCCRCVARCGWLQGVMKASMLLQQAHSFLPRSHIPLGKRNEWMLARASSLFFCAFCLTTPPSTQAHLPKPSNPLVSISLFAPCSLLFLLPVAFINEPTALDALFASGAGSVVFANACTAFTLNVAVVVLVSQTSGLTLVLAGIIKDIILIVAAIWLFGNPITYIQVAGYTLALYGLNMYHGYRSAPKGSIPELSSLARHAATDRNMAVMAGGMLLLLFVAQ